jgi:voltage-gated potassium channel
MAKRLLVPAFILTLVYLGGCYGFNVLERWTYFDSAFYITMAVTSVAAYGNMVPSTQSGKMLLMIISLVGVVNMLYIFSILADIMSRHDDRNREIIKGLLRQKEIDRGDSL